MSFDITYYSFNATRADKNWLEQGQVKVDSMLKSYENQDTKNLDFVDEIKNNLKQIDLELGGISNLDFGDAVITNDSKRLIYYVGALHEVFNLEQDSETITRDNFIYIFKNINQENINKVVTLLEGEGFEFEDAKTSIVSFLIETKPLVKDLVEHSDSVVYVDYHGSVDGEPKEVEELLNQRVETNYNKYCEIKA